MSEREKKPKPNPFATYEAWALERVKLRRSVAGNILYCRTPRLLNAPKYLVGGDTKEERQYRASKLLTVLRNTGVLVCTDGIWWRRNGARWPVKPETPKPARAQPAKTRIVPPKRLPTKLRLVK